MKNFNIAISLAAVMAPAFKRSFEQANASITSINEKLRDHQKVWRQVYEAQKRGIINPESAQNAYNKLNESAFKLNGLQSKYSKLLEKSIHAWGNFAISEQLLKGIFNLSKDAMNFESSMADVRKVVDFETPQQFKQMGEDILSLSTKIPMAAEGLAQIVAAGGQSGIAREDLLKFAEAAAKMGVAFDVSADQAGEMMAKWRTAFKMNQDQVVVLADQINHLGNTTAASAPLISDVVTRVGPLGSVGGVAAGEIAALGAAMVGSGIQSEVAATGIKNLILALVKGEKAEKRQKEALMELGFESSDMAAAMQKDARGAILSVFDALRKVDAEERAGVLKELFGSESLNAIAPLLSNLDNLKKNFKEVGDAEKYGGSMQGEFDARSKTTANSIQLMENRIAKAKIQLSNGFLPYITQGAELLGGFADNLGTLSREFPGLTAGVIATLTGLTALYTVTSLSTAVIVSVQTAVAGLTTAYGFLTAAETKQMAIQKVSAVWTKAVTAAQWLFNASLWGCPILIIGAAIVAIGYVIYKEWDSIKALAGNMWDAGVAAIEWFCNSVKSVYDKIKGWWQELYNLLTTPISTHVSAYINKRWTQDDIPENATGGIYRQGAFMTSFAETDGESAIPHTPNAHNIGLLAKTNEIMGNPLGGSVNATFSPVINITGGGDADSIRSVLEDERMKFRRMLNEVLHEQRRVAYA